MSKLKILVVEDEMLVALDIRESLESLGYEVQNTVATGKAAIENVEKSLPDVILMDIILKGPMTGIETATQIRSKHDVPIIYLTANADIATIEKAKISLPYGYIIKPFTEKDLQTNIEIARFKFENDLKLKIESDHYSHFFNSGKADNHFIIEGQAGLEKINFNNVYFVELSQDKAVIHLLDEEITIRQNPDEFEHLLPSDKFVRVSSTHFVNTDKIFLVRYPEIIIAEKMDVIVLEEAYKKELQQRTMNK